MTKTDCERSNKIMPANFISHSAKAGIGLPDLAQELLLHAALGDENVASQAWRDWRLMQGSEALNFRALDMDSRRLLPLVGYNLHHLGESIPEADAIKHITRLEWARTRYLFKAMSEANGVLQAGGIEVLLIKGAPLALLYYPAPGLRPMNDGDFLVRLASFDAAVGMLLRAGWQVEGKAMSSPGHHASPFRNSALQEIDVHRFALGECPFALQDEEFWRDAVPVSLNGVSSSATNATYTLFMCCVNSVHSPVRWVADSVMLMRESEIDWPRLLRQATGRSLSLITCNALRYLQHHFHAPVPDYVLDALFQTPVSRVEKREYRAWGKENAFGARTAIRYASYRRLLQSQPSLSLSSYLQLLGNLSSRRQIPAWILARCWKTFSCRLTHRKKRSEKK